MAPDSDYFFTDTECAPMIAERFAAMMASFEYIADCTALMRYTN